MKIAATFIARKHDPDVLPELVCAWDEYCIDGNPEGYAEALRHALDAVGSDLLSQVTVNIDVDITEVERILAGTSTLRGTVEIPAGTEPDAHWTCQGCEREGTGDGPDTCPSCGSTIVFTFLPAKA